MNETLDYDRKMWIIDLAAIFCETAHEAADIEWNNEEELVNYLKSDHIPKNSHKLFMGFLS